MVSKLRIIWKQTVGAGGDASRGELTTAAQDDDGQANTVGAARQRSSTPEQTTKSGEQDAAPELEPEPVEMKVGPGGAGGVRVRFHIIRNARI